MRLLTVLLFGMFLVSVQVFLVLKAVQNNLFETSVDVVDELVERQTSIVSSLTPEERAWLAAHPAVTAGVDPDFYPVEMVDSQGRYTGIGPDYLRVVTKLTGLTFHVDPPSNWADTASRAAAGQVDVYTAAAETDHRAEYMAFTPTYITLPGIIVIRRNHKRTSFPEDAVRNLADLAGKRVAVVNRYSWHDFLDERHPEIIAVPVANTLEGLQQVAFGEVDAMMDYQFNITEKINASGIRNLRVASVIEAPYGHAFGVRRDWPELLSILSKALQQITPEERRIISAKWLQPYEEKTFSKQNVWLMLFAAEVLFAVFSFVLYWNFSLKRQVARRTVQLKQELVKYDRAEKALRESRAMLEQSNVELEHRVSERTRDLQAINAELQLAKEAADAATIAKSQFLANISHEVRTPLHGIMAFAELALMKEKTPPHRYLRAIMESSRALLEIINDLLDVSKIEAGHLELEQAPFMLDDVVHHVCTVALHNAQAGGIELVVDMEPSMQLALVGDAGRLQQILMNLVTNAVKFTGPGGQISVSLRQAAAESRTDISDAVLSSPAENECPESVQRVRVICFVRDTGVGIAPEFMNQLFQPFRQVDASTTRRHGGTGLGLCICRQLVEMMHGEISVESELGAGSTFAFSVPFVAQPESPSCTLAIRKHQPQRVFILSLSPLQTEVLCRHFSVLGIETVTATSTSEALHTITQVPDLLFLDRKLAEPGTLYALRLLRSTFGQTIPAILMDEHAGEQILNSSNGNDGQVAILPVVTLRGLREAVASLDEPCVVAYSARLHALPRPVATPLFHDVRILAAEDNPTNQEIMEALFEDTGVQLTIVSNGKQALDALRVGTERGNAFDLVLMDVQMPVMDGYEATRIIRTMPELDTLPIVAITAHAMHEDKMRALSAGIARYLSKPLSRASLFGTLLALLPHKISPRGSESVQTLEQPPHSNEQPRQTGQTGQTGQTSQTGQTGQTGETTCQLSTGLDPDALQRLNVPLTTYHTIVRGFVRSTALELASMRHLVDSEEQDASLEELVRATHNLKGAAANVGAVSVQQAAHALECAAQRSDTSALAALLDALTQTFAVVEASIQTMPTAEPSVPIETTCPHPAETSLADTARLQALREALAVADPERIAETLPSLVGVVPAAVLHELQELLDSYDYDEALALLSEMD